MFNWLSTLFPRRAGLRRPPHIEALAGSQFMSREPELLKLARDWMPLLPFEQIDVLIVDEMGKNISGSGMDPNVLGRRARHSDEHERVR